LCGDSPGGGKGQVAAAFVLEWHARARSRTHLYLVKREACIAEVVEDFGALVTPCIQIAPLRAFKPTQGGVIVVSYGSLCDQVIENIERVLGGTDFDGAIVFDEIDKAGGARTAEYVLRLQKDTPHARVLYLTQTTSLNCFALMPRLGLYGGAFPSYFDLQRAVAHDGGFDLFAREMKRCGSYVAHAFGFLDTTVRVVTAQLSTHARDAHDLLMRHCANIHAQNARKVVETRLMSVLKHALLALKMRDVVRIAQTYLDVNIVPRVHLMGAPALLDHPRTRPSGAAPKSVVRILLEDLENIGATGATAALRDLDDSQFPNARDMLPCEVKQCLTSSVHICCELGQGECLDDIERARPDEVVFVKIDTISETRGICSSLRKIDHAIPAHQSIFASPDEANERLIVHADVRVTLSQFFFRSSMQPLQAQSLLIEKLRDVRPLAHGEIFTSSMNKCEPSSDEVVLNDGLEIVRTAGGGVLLCGTLLPAWPRLRYLVTSLHFSKIPGGRCGIPLDPTLTAADVLCLLELDEDEFHHLLRLRRVLPPGAPWTSGVRAILVDKKSIPPVARPLMVFRPEAWGAIDKDLVHGVCTASGCAWGTPECRTFLNCPTFTYVVLVYAPTAELALSELRARKMGLVAASAVVSALKSDYESESESEYESENECEIASDATRADVSRVLEYYALTPNADVRAALERIAQSVTVERALPMELRNVVEEEPLILATSEHPANVAARIECVLVNICARFPRGSGVALRDLQGGSTSSNALRRAAMRGASHRNCTQS
jgi:hypothetical protein